jgi:hypothetical protein
MAPGSRSARRAAWPSAPWARRRHGAVGPSKPAERGLRPPCLARPALGTAQRLHPGGLWRRASSPARARGLPGGMREVGQSLRALTPQRHAAPAHSTSRPPRGGLTRDLGPPPAAPQHGDCLRIALGVCGLAALDGRHGEGMAQATRPPCTSATIGAPVPRDDTGDTDDPVCAGGRKGLEQGGWPSGHMAMHQARSMLVEETEGPRASVHVDATITLVRLGVKAPEVSSSLRWFFPSSAYHRGMLRRGPQ